MKLRVKDIVKIWNNGAAASLVAGQEGLMRRIEVFDMMEQPNIKPWLREHLLLITTGYVIRNDKEALLNLIRDMNEVNASALAIKTRFFDDFPKEALQLADELKLPLFFLDNNAGFVELVFPVMTAIVESRSNIELDTRYQIGKENKSELDNRLFFDLINRKITQPEEAEYRTASLQWPSEPVRMIALSLETEKNSFLLEMKKEQQTKAISRILGKNHIRNAVICSKEMCFALMGISINDTLDTIVNDMIQKTVEINNCACSAIISNPLSDYLKLADTYQKLKERFSYSVMIRKQRVAVYFLDELQYDRIMPHPKTRKYTNSIRCAWPIMEYDRAHDTQYRRHLKHSFRIDNSANLSWNPFCIEILWYIVSTRSKKCCIAAWMIQK
ncbi:MAG: PucR family transcriptional regulator ligand-binding domain-containing protein [Blautia massiliensis (ex Durand et al. 2017)]